VSTVSRKVRYGLGAAGVVALVGLYRVSGRDEDMPAWALALVVLVVVAMSVVQDLALCGRRDPPSR